MANQEMEAPETSITPRDKLNLDQIEIARIASHLRRKHAKDPKKLPLIGDWWRANDEAQCIAYDIHRFKVQKAESEAILDQNENDERHIARRDYCVETIKAMTARYAEVTSKIAAFGKQLE